MDRSAGARPGRGESADFGASPTATPCSVDTCAGCCGAFLVYLRVFWYPLNVFKDVLVFLYRTRIGWRRLSAAGEKFTSANFSQFFSSLTERCFCSVCYILLAEAPRGCDAKGIHCGADPSKNLKKGGLIWTEKSF